VKEGVTTGDSQMVPEHAMTEGRVHTCSWKRVRGGYRVWLKSDPTIAAEHAQFAEANEPFIDLICEASARYIF
jgi:hypothetical protein